MNAIHGCAMTHCWMMTLLGSLAAQDLTPTPAPQRQAVYIYNAKLHTVSDGVLDGGALMLRDGKIAGIWAKDQQPTVEGDAAVQVDAQGKHVYPGLISPWTALGLSELGSLPDTIDLDELGDLNPEVRAGAAVNPDATAIPVTRLNGVLCAGIAPSGGLLPGRLSVLALAGWTVEDMALSADAGVIVEWPAPGGRGRGRRGRGAEPTEDPRERARKAIDTLRELVAQARSYTRARAADQNTPRDLRYEGLRRVLLRECPLFIRVSSRAQIEQAVDWATKENLRLVLVGAEQAADCIELLKRHDVPVIVAGPHRLPERRDANYDDAFTLPARLDAAGLRWCLAYEFGGFANERNLPYAMGTAIAFGLDRRSALRAMTLSTAEILGVADRVGSLAVGKDATLFVCDGEPWEHTTKISDVWIFGRKVELMSKQTELVKKYRAKYLEQSGK